ncbi:TonB-dependent receptor [Acinetobacter chinensis]|uniref:TonB-dependent receptor n=1 Tax=Acinetobacter chinensis TaxID=2004650 RepID=UPI002934E950|nr:TonB-dependent siderophore receptor [Acinetobacter chinensis]WOE42316.1 TonB-dependent siderophore receptor [Acinetobacter chinensis]
MKVFSKKILVSSVGLIMMGGCFSQMIWADEGHVLPVIKTKAEADPQGFADGKLAEKTKLGILGERKVVDTPYTVTEYTKELIEQQQAATVGQILKNDASIRITSNQGHLNENFKIRGFDVNHEDMNYNGFYGMAPYGRVPTEFLETVTVLKGPNALVAGVPPTGSVGAVVIANSKRADKDRTQVSAMYEDGGYYKSGFDFSRRFGESKEFGVRVNGVYGDGEHIIEGMEDRHASGALAADYTTDKLKINFDSYAIREDRKGGSPAMIAMGPDVKNKYGSVDHILAAPKGGLNYFPHLSGNTDSKFAGLSGEYAFTPDLKAYAGVGYAEKEYAGHLFGTRMIVGKEDGTATSQYYRVGANEKNTAANAGIESKFNTGAIKHTVGLRTDYLKRKVNQHEGRGAAQVDFETNIYNPSSQGNMPLTKPNIVPLADNEYTSYSLTDQLSVLDDKLQLILGLRYQDIDTRNLVNKTNYNEDKVSPSLGIVVKPFGEDLSLYASYVEGLTEGSTVNNVNDVNDKVTFAPFKTKQYEFGTKYQKGSWLNTLALYQIEKPGVMTVSIPKDANGKTQQTTDGVETRSRGVEWAFSGKVLEDLSLMGGVAYTDAEYTKGKAKISGKDEDVSGKKIYGVPEWTATLGLDYAVPFVDGLSVNTRASYVGEQYTNNRNTLELPDFTIWDLGARYKTKVGGVNTTFLANVDNVTNKKYWEGIFNPDYLVVGGARTYKVGVTFDF